jgi:hypothetical protein
MPCHTKLHVDSHVKFRVSCCCSDLDDRTMTCRYPKEALRWVRGMNGRLQESPCRQWLHFGGNIQVRVKSDSAAHNGCTDPRHASETAVVLEHLAGAQGMVVGWQATTGRTLVHFPDRTRLWCEMIDWECLHYE